MIAGKPVTVKLYDATNTLVVSIPANLDGTFSLTAPAGIYAVVATSACASECDEAGSGK